MPTPIGVHSYTLLGCWPFSVVHLMELSFFFSRGLSCICAGEGESIHNVRSLLFYCIIGIYIVRLMSILSSFLLGPLGPHLGKRKVESSAAIYIILSMRF